MTESEAKKYMLIEKECINRDCNRDCANCDIVQDVEDLNNAYDVAINALEKQIPKVSEHEDGVWSICPCCGGSVCNDTEHAVNREVSYCEHCGQAIDWSEQLSLYEIEHGRNFKGNKNAR